MYPNLLLNFTPTFSYIWASYIADCDVQVDLTGGYHDAGDNVKFGLPMAFSLTMLSWGVVEFRDALRRTGQLGNTLNAIRWGTDYLLKASTGPNELWVQVSIRHHFQILFSDIFLRSQITISGTLKADVILHEVTTGYVFKSRLAIPTPITIAGKDPKKVIHLARATK